MPVDVEGRGFGGGRSPESSSGGFGAAGAARLDLQCRQHSLIEGMHSRAIRGWTLPTP